MCYLLIAIPTHKLGVFLRKKPSLSIKFLNFFSFFIKYKLHISVLNTFNMSLYHNLPVLVSGALPCKGDLE